MSIDLNDKLIVAISSRALFDLEEENRIFENSNENDYMKLQMQRLELPAKAGVAYSLVKKLLAFNTENKKHVEVVMLSRNDPQTGARIFRSSQSLNINLERGVFTRGREPFRYLKPFGAHLFLSANENDVRKALSMNFAAAKVFTQSKQASENYPNELRIAFDGDAVLFSGESEQIFQEKGLEAFITHEKEKATQPLPAGPFKPLLQALHQLQQTSISPNPPMRIRTTLITARSAPTHERALYTLRHWGITIDEAMFLGGLNKGDFLKEFEPDFFFDDQIGHVQNASPHVPSGHVTT